MTGNAHVIGKTGDSILNYDNILIFGARTLATDSASLLMEICPDKLRGFAVSDMSDNPSNLNGLPVRTLQDWNLNKDRTAVYISVRLYFHQEVELLLHELGYKHIFKMNVEMSLLYNIAFKAKTRRILNFH